jgi:uncharacterized membrane protein (GlpM family)
VTPSRKAGFYLLAVAVVVALGARSPHQLIAIVPTTPLFALVGFLLVVAPDALEQLLITGGLT